MLALNHIREPNLIGILYFHRALSLSRSRSFCERAGKEGDCFENLSVAHIPVSRLCGQVGMLFHDQIVGAIEADGHAVENIDIDQVLKSSR